MATATTSYDVMIRFMVESRGAARAMADISRRAQGMGRRLMTLEERNARWKIRVQRNSLRQESAGAERLARWKRRTEEQDFNRRARLLKRENDLAKKQRMDALNSISLTRMAVGAAAAGYGAYKAGSAIKSTFLDFNANKEQSINQIATSFALANQTSFNSELKNSVNLYSQLQKRAETLPGTTEDYVQVAGQLTQPIIDAGLNMKDLENMTVNTVVAAKAFGVGMVAAINDVEQGIRGQYSLRDKLTTKALANQGFVGDEGRKRFRALSQNQRANVIKQGLGQEQIVQAGRAQGRTFEGRVDQVTSKLRQLAGKAGEALFNQIKDELTIIGNFLQKNPKKLQDAVKKVSEVLVTTFQLAKSTMNFIIDNASLIKGLLVGVLALKGTNAIVQSFSMGLGGATRALGVFAAAAAAFAIWVDSQQEKELAVKSNAPQLAIESMRYLAGGKTSMGFSSREKQRQMQMGVARAKQTMSMEGLQAFKAAGYIGDMTNLKRTGDLSVNVGNIAQTQASGIVDQTFIKMNKAFTGTKTLGQAIADLQAPQADEEMQKVADRTLEVLMGMANALQRVEGLYMGPQGKSAEERLAELTAKMNKDKDKDKKPAVQNIIINVESNDPDRFSQGLEGIMSDWLRNPSQAQAALRPR